jgi:hypothetical protein
MQGKATVPGDGHADLPRLRTELHLLHTAAALAEILPGVQDKAKKVKTKGLSHFETASFRTLKNYKIPLTKIQNGRKITIGEYRPFSAQVQHGRGPVHRTGPPGKGRQESQPCGYGSLRCCMMPITIQNLKKGWSKHE